MFPVNSETLCSLCLEPTGQVPTTAEIVLQLNHALGKASHLLPVLTIPFIDLKLCQPLLRHQPGRCQVCLAPTLKAMQQANLLA